MEETHLFCLLKKKNPSQAVVVDTFNGSTLEAEAGGSCWAETSLFIKWVSGQPRLYRESCLRKKKDFKLGLVEALVIWCSGAWERKDWELEDSRGYSARCCLKGGKKEFYSILQIKHNCCGEICSVGEKNRHFLSLGELDNHKSSSSCGFSVLILRIQRLKCMDHRGWV